MVRHHHKLLLFGSGIYFFGVSAFMLQRNIWLSPDQFFIFALIVALFIGMGKKFIRDWTPFILVFLGYEFLRGAVPAITKFPVHSRDLIQLEQAIFSALPTVYLQQHWLNPQNLRWYDFLLSLSYMSYFVIPLFFAFYAWLSDSKLFRLFAIGFLILHYSAFITYVIFPTMPPWMASSQGLIPPIHRVLYQTTAAITIPGSFPTVYNFFAPNPVAAVPSLHAALPTLMFLVCLAKRKKLLASLFLVYSLTVYLAIVYLGEHYAVDALAGIIYAVLTYLLTQTVVAYFSNPQHTEPLPVSSPKPS